MGEFTRFGRRRAGPTLPLRSGLADPAPRRDWLPTLGILTAAFIASAGMFSLLFAGGAVPAPQRAAAVAIPRTADLETARFTLCVSGRGTNCVIDGDTFRYRGEIVRIADIDTPEVRNYGCAAEKVRGDAATARLLALINAGPFTLAPYERDHDQYGRALRILTREGKSLGMTLVAEGLARAWDGARRGWC